MISVNFNAIQYESIDGTTGHLNIKRDLANILYMQGETIEESELGRRIFNTPAEIELSPEDVEIVIKYVKKYYTSIVVKNAITNSLK